MLANLSENSESLEQDSCVEQLVKKTLVDSVVLNRLIDNDEEFRKKIVQLVGEGVNKIQMEEYNLAIVYLREAERVLEHGASCGKAIDRTLITATLHNEACVFHRLQKLEKSFSYLQAIIYNITNYISSLERQLKLFEENKLSHNLFSTRENLIIYHLQLSGVASSLGSHQFAYKSAMKSMELIQKVCKDLSRASMTSTKSSFHRKLTILNFIADFDCQINAANLQEERELTKSIIRKQIKKRKIFVNYNADFFTNFSIENVLQINPVTVAQLEALTALKEQTLKVSQIKKALYYSISLFLAATELRSIATQRYKNEDEFKCSQQLIQSQKYHLKAIQIACEHLPHESSYLYDLYKSFKQRFGVEIHNVSLLDDDMSSVDGSSKKLMLSSKLENPQEHPKYCISINFKNSSKKTVHQKQISSTKKRKSKSEIKCHSIHRNKKAVKLNSENTLTINKVPFTNQSVKKMIQISKSEQTLLRPELTHRKGKNIKVKSKLKETSSSKSKNSMKFRHENSKSDRKHSKNINRLSEEYYMQEGLEKKKAKNGQFQSKKRSRVCNRSQEKVEKWERTSENK